jgi:hypothetical protein
MFQPVLFDPDPTEPLPPSETSESGPPELVELWFAGNLGDVGGGWKMYPGEKYLLSDIPLMWMIEQVREIDAASEAS